MRNVILLTMGVLLALVPCASAQQSATAKANARYRQGLRAIDQGQVEIARECFREVLRLQPANPSARYQLKQLSLRKPRLLAKKRELKLKAVKIPAVDFDEMTLREALETLNALVEKQTKGKFVPNFIVQDPKGVLEDRKFSLKLGSVPASIVLQYALDNTRATARYDEHAIVIRPLTSGKSATEKGSETPAKPVPEKKSDPFTP